jgi:NADPH-dependent glutamate synthase beta subunit-like oxidoreductase
MPAFPEEIEAALEEGVKLLTLVSPIEIVSRDGALTGLRVINNQLGETDSSGRRKPVPVPGSEHVVPLDTLIVAISETPESECLANMGIDVDRGRLRIDRETLCTTRNGVFGGGDVVTGPNTVVEAIASGKLAATMIDRYINGEELNQASEPRLPKEYIEQVPLSAEEVEQVKRVKVPTIPACDRKDFAEVEMGLSVDDAVREARRCLRCDLEFTRPDVEKEETPVAEEQRV